MDKLQQYPIVFSRNECLMYCHAFFYFCLTHIDISTHMVLLIVPPKGINNRLALLSSRILQAEAM